MKVLIIDFGKYSIKLLETHIEKRRLIYADASEIILPLENPTAPNTPFQFLTPVVLDQIEKYIQSRKNIRKVICTLPASYLTARFLTLPIASIKKAELAVPFQLDKELPQSIQNIVYAGNFISGKNQTHVVTSVVQKDLFETFLKKLNQHNIQPHIITSDLAAIHNFINKNKISSSTAFIILGHETTQIYFVTGSRVTTSHLSYVGGRTIDENISQIYQIPMQEAIQYKHDNAFLLTEDQYANVSSDQKDFARMMEKIFSPLISDFNKLALGHKMLHGKSINHLYISGGCSNIQNITNFFSEKLSIKTQHLLPQDALTLKNVTLDNAARNSFTPLHLCALTMIYPDAVANFRKGEYALQVSQNIPFESAIFVFTRAAIMAIVLLFFVSLERVLLIHQERSLNQKITQILKRSEINIPSKDQRRFEIKPQFILNKLDARKKEITREIKALNDHNQIDGFTPIVKIFQTFPQSDQYHLLQINVQESFYSFQFQFPENKIPVEFNMKLENLANNKDIVEDRQNSTLAITIKRKVL